MCSVHPVFLPVWQQWTAEVLSLQVKDELHMFTLSLWNVSAAFRLLERDKWPITARKQQNCCFLLPEKDGHQTSRNAHMCTCTKTPTNPNPCHMTPLSMREVGLGWSPKSSKVCRCPHCLLRTWHEVISTQVNQRRLSEVWFTRRGLLLNVVLDPAFVHL